MEASVDPQCRGPDWMPITPKTGSLFHAETQLMSLPSRERGSKQHVLDRQKSAGCVAPFTGARIETLSCRTLPPVAVPSLPSRERGSKHAAGAYLPASAVAPFTGARIETVAGPYLELFARGRSLHGSADRNVHDVIRHLTGPTVAPLTGARIETLQNQRVIVASIVAPFTGARIETTTCGHRSWPRAGRSLHGSADRNIRARRQEH